MNVRTFVSVDIPMNSAVHGFTDRLNDIRGVRTVPSENIHLTLAFIGDVDDSDLDAMIPCLERAASHHSDFTVRLEGVGTFPDNGDPKIVWIDARSDGRLEALSESVRKELGSGGVETDNKRFRAHVTVGRISGHADLEDTLGEYRDLRFCEFECGGINLMRSTLHPTGAEYSVVSSMHFRQLLH